MSKIKITLNGEDFFCKAGESVSNLIENLKLDIRKIAVEKNYQIILQEQFAKEMIKENDKVEIVYFVGGG